MKSRQLPILILLALILAASAAHGSAAPVARGKGRIFVLMVWDGLRPDFVNQRDTPNLFAVEREGVSFPDHHAVFPSVTMANAAAIATGYPPGDSGIFSDTFYLPSASSEVGFKLASTQTTNAINLENTPHLIALDQPGVLNGNLLEAVGLGQRVRLAHGYVAVAGKSGPTFMFDSREFTAQGTGKSGTGRSVLIADDIALAPALLKQIGLSPGKETAGVLFAARDAWYADAVIAELPAAVAASNNGHPALLVLWERNPDATQHRAGLGTEEGLEALSRNDLNLGRLRAAIEAQQVGDRTDLMVVSDHGFVTLRDSLRMGDLLVSAGLKRSHTSDDVVVVGDQGSDLIYLSNAAFPSIAARKARLQQIVDFVLAQDWSGPLFSRDPEPRSAARGHQGWIAGTFDERLLGLDDTDRAPDLIISMREHSDENNLTLTGPDHPAFVLRGNGRESASNHSEALVRPVTGVMDADGTDKLTTGMGAHGAIGRREIHNFCAAAGPDFRRHFVDPCPTGNTDVAPTIARILGLRPVRRGKPAAWSGRVMSEALVRGSRTHARVTPVTIIEHRDLPPFSIETRLLFTHLDGHRYLDDASVRREPLRVPKPLSASSAPSP